MALPKVLLLQARREDDPEREAERRSFAERLELPEDRVIGHNLLTGLPDLRHLEEYDALFIGGSGEFYVSNGRFPRQEEVLSLLREAVVGPTPIFGSCFGFHLMTEALGGRIRHDPERMEVGTHELELTEAGRGDEVFGILPDRFWAQVGRKDRAVALPEGAENLASSELSPFHGFRYKGGAVWASQFHPELDAETNRGRYLSYLEGYAGLMDEQERLEVLSSFRESPETAWLLKRFLDLVLS